MKSRLTEEFVARFADLPEAVQQQTRKSCRLWCDDPSHPGLHFKLIHRREQLYSVRIGLGWRALGLKEGDTVTWFWIGSHADYDRLLKQL